MYKRTKKAISKLLVLLMLVTTIFGNIGGLNVLAGDTTNSRTIDVWDFGGVSATSPYPGVTCQNNISVSNLDSLGSNTTKGSIVAGNYTFGDLSLTTTGDRIYYYSSGTILGTNSYGTPTVFTNFGDGYGSSGQLYFSGAGSSTGKRLEINNVKQGDIITLYGFISGTSPTANINYQLTNTNSNVTTKIDTTTMVGNKVAGKSTYLAQDSGTLKIYFDSVTGSGKPQVARITRTPGVKVSGALNLNGYPLSGYSLIFQKQTGDKEIYNATLNPDGTYDVILAAGYSYTAVLQGVSSSYSISDGTKSLSTAPSDISAGINKNLDVALSDLAVASGNISGFDSGYSLTNFKITFTPPTGSLAPSVEATIDKVAMTYTADLRLGQDYSIVISGVNDYNLTSSNSVNINVNTVQNITVAPKTVYAVSGSFVGLPVPVTVSNIKFTNTDGYVYNGTVTGGGYTASLRDGAYTVTAVCSDATYSTTGHVVVSGSNTTKDIKFSTSTAPSSLTWVSDLYVGDSSKANNYNTVKEALADAARMNPTSEAQRITIHIAPGTYRAQLKIATPYISLVSSDPSQEVKITWYYGVGYDYYSAGADGFYNEDRAFDKYLKGFPGSAKWGATVFLANTAKGFKAENIVFENSFNKYITNEELADGVQPTTINTPTNLTVRTAGLDATSRPATERAAAMGIEADNVEFSNCSFLSNQDTLYTGTATINQYYKNCFIEGNTDYIFGDGNAVFDKCILNFCGYSDQAAGGYITAAKDEAAYGYLFRDCTVTAKANKMQAPGCFGRPWGQGARVKFLDTKLQDSSLISPQGWTNMSSALAVNANFFEYNTTFNGVAVDTTSRVRGVLTSEAAVTNVANYFGSDWTPSYYTASSVTAPVLQVSSTTQTQAVLNWQNSTSTIGSVMYAVYKDGQKLCTTTESTYTVGGLAQSTSYTFKVVAMNTAGNTAASADVQATTKNTAAPTAPVISATAGNSQATITWATVPDAAYYTLKGRLASDSVYNMVSTINDTSLTSYTYSSLQNGTTYYFILTASNSYGESLPSVGVTVTPTSSGTAPIAPSINATAGGASAAITWNAVEGATSYTIKGGKSIGDYSMVHTVNGGNTTTYTYTGLTYGVTYYFVVTASNSFGESLPSNVVSITTGSNVKLKPSDFIGADVGNPAISGTSSFNDDTNLFTLSGAGTGMYKTASGGVDQFYFNGVKIKGDFTISAKLNVVNWTSAFRGNIGLTVRESLTDGLSYHFTQLEQYASTAVGGRKAYRYNGSSNGSNAMMPLTGYAYVKLTKVGDSITSIISTSPIPDNPVASTTLVISTATATNLGLDSSGNMKELYVGLLATSTNKDLSISATFEDVKIIMADGTVAFDANEGKPIAPKNVKAKPYNNSALITWDALSTATSYTVKQSTSNAGPFTTVKTVTGSVYQTMLTGLDNEKTYYYVVTASNASGESVESKVVSVTPSASVLIPPVITMTSAVPASEVFSALLPFSGSVNKASTITIKNNGNLVKLDGNNTNLYLSKNGTFNKTLILTQGVNNIEIKALDDYGLETTINYTVIYTYKVANIVFCDTNDNVVTSLIGGKEIIVKADTENYIETTKDNILFVGLYDANNILVKFTFTAEAMSNGESEVFYAKIKLPYDVSGYTVKAFVWDNFTNMHPVSDVVVLK